MRTANGQPSNLLLWFSILAAPTAWAAHLSIEYFLTTADCQLAGNIPTWWMLATATALFVPAVLGLAAGLGALRVTSGADAPESTETRRRRFMASCGVLLSLLFLVGLVMATIPIVFLEPCRAGA